MKLFKWFKPDWKLVEVYKYFTQEIKISPYNFGKFTVYAQLYYSKRRNKYKYKIQNARTTHSMQEILYIIQKDIIKFQKLNKI